MLCLFAVFGQKVTKKSKPAQKGVKLAQVPRTSQSTSTTVNPQQQQ